jgi:hypothetical protein
LRDLARQRVPNLEISDEIYSLSNSNEDHVAVKSMERLLPASEIAKQKSGLAGSGVMRRRNTWALHAPATGRMLNSRAILATRRESGTAARLPRLVSE